MPATPANFGSLHPALGYGAGIRWRSPVGPLRLDLGLRPGAAQVPAALQRRHRLLTVASTDNPNPPAPAADTAATAVPPVVAPARPVATGLGLLVPLLAIVALLLVLLLALAGGARWLLFNEDGARWVLARAPMVQVKGFQGALLGERWQAEQVKLSWDGGKASVTIDDLVAEGLRWTWRPHEHAWLALDAQKLTVRAASP
jgi:hypothetical protein